MNANVQHVKSEDVPKYQSLSISAKSGFENDFENEVIDRAMAILQARIHKPDFHIHESKDVENYLKLKLALRESEVFGVLFLSSPHGVIAYEELFYGTINGASVHLREVMKRALFHNAAAVVLVHNHPSGSPRPSEADIQITKRAKALLHEIDVNVLDHLLVAGDSVVSFAERGIF